MFATPPSIRPTSDALLRSARRLSARGCVFMLRWLTTR